MASRHSQDYSTIELVANQCFTHGNSFSENSGLQTMFDDGLQINFQRTGLEVDVGNQDSSHYSAYSNVEYHPSPQSRRKRLLYGGIVAFFLVMVAAVLGGVFGSRANKKSSSSPFPASNTISNVQAVMNTPAPTTAALSVAAVTTVSSSTAALSVAAVTIISSSTATLSVAAVTTVSSSTTANQEKIDTNAYYRLTNMYLGISQSLDVVTDASHFGKLKMANSGNSSGQFWHFALLNTNIDHPKYALRTQLLGEGFSLDVDVYIDNTALHLATTGNSTGQSWTITPWEEQTESFRLTNDFTGPELALDTYADTHEPFMDSDENVNGQYWRLKKVCDFQG